MTRINPDIKTACDIILSGGVAALPTETVYGLAADATNYDAVSRIFLLKNRPNFNPLISHISDMNMAQNYGYFSQTALKLAHKFWPGALTFIVPKHKIPLNNTMPIAGNVTAGLDTIGLRMPLHPIMQNVIRMVNKPLAAPSANISGGISPTDCHHVKISFGQQAPFIVDGGACAVGLESTILHIFDNQVTLLRQGGISADEIMDFIGHIHIADNIKNNKDIIAPGQLLKHYAPKTPVLINQTDCTIDDGFIGFGTDYIPHHAKAFYQLSDTKNLTQAAQNLFSALYDMDMRQVKNICIAPIPDMGVGRAMNERIMRAATHK